MTDGHDIVDSLGEQEAQSEQENEDLETIEELFQTLKLTVPTEENMDTVKMMLSKTVDLRVLMMKDKKVDVLESFPVFFTNPDLVKQKKHCCE